MTDPATIGKKLQDIAAALDGIEDARLGLNSLTITPAVEVWLQDGEMTQRRAAGQGHIAEEHNFQVAFYIPLTRNLDADEIQIGGFIKAFVDTIHAPDFDYTLGGIVEITRADRWAFDLISRNNRVYRAGIIGVTTELI